MLKTNRNLCGGALSGLSCTWKNVWLALLLCLFGVSGGLCAERPLARGHVPSAVKRLSLSAAQRYAPTNRLELAIGLPLRNREALQQLLDELYDPASPRYHRYLTPQQFAASFGPTPEQYNAVKAYARSNGLTVTGTHANRLLLDVSGAAENVERAFRVRLLVWPHPQEARTFYAPAAEPSVDSEIPILDVSGLDDFQLSHSAMLQETSLAEDTGLTPNAGTGLEGTYQGNDFRTAYLPGVWLTGAGQSVALVELDGFYPKDLSVYATTAGTTPPPVRKVLVDGFSGSPGKANPEVALDIDMVMSMAPGLSNVFVYEAPNKSKSLNDLLNRIATDDLAAQISSSWQGASGPSATTDQIFLQFAAQGQSFFQASGDRGAYPGPVDEPCDNPYITVVGGTSLSTSDGGRWSPPAGSWTGESVWNRGGTNGGSGGGISTVYSIPAWQQGMDMSANQGSSTMRNLPDVAMVADNIFLVCNNGKMVRASSLSDLATNYF